MALAPAPASLLLPSLFSASVRVVRPLLVNDDGLQTFAREMMIVRNKGGHCLTLTETSGRSNDHQPSSIHSLIVYLLFII